MQKLIKKTQDDAVKTVKEKENVKKSGGKAKKVVGSQASCWKVVKTDVLAQRKRLRFLEDEANDD